MTLHCTHLLPQWGGVGAAAVGRSSRRRLRWYPPPSSQYLSPCLPPSSSFGLKGICSTESTCASERAGSYGLKLDTGRKGASDGRAEGASLLVALKAKPRDTCLSLSLSLSLFSTRSSGCLRCLDGVPESNPRRHRPAAPRPSVGRLARQRRRSLRTCSGEPSLRTHTQAECLLPRSVRPTDRQFESGGMSSDTD